MLTSATKLDKNVSSKAAVPPILIQILYHKIIERLHATIEICKIFQILYHPQGLPYYENFSFLWHSRYFRLPS